MTLALPQLVYHVDSIKVSLDMMQTLHFVAKLRTFLGHFGLSILGSQEKELDIIGDRRFLKHQSVMIFLICKMV